MKNPVTKASNLNKNLRTIFFSNFTKHSKFPEQV